ncbi:MAG: hypothetical protein ACP5N1_07135 [Candidatus Woesearchaeota archaeon]
MSYGYNKRGNLASCLVIILFVLLFAIVSSNVYAFGISTPYFEDNVLKVNSGKQYVYPVTIQNGDDQDYYVDIIYSSTANIAHLIEEKYYVPKETYDTIAHFLIYIPNDANIGDKYTLDYTVKPKTSDTTLTINDSLSFAVDAVEIHRYLTIEVTDIVYTQTTLLDKTLNLYLNYVFVQQHILSFILRYTLPILLSGLVIIVLVIITFKRKKISKKQTKTIPQKLRISHIKRFVNAINILNPLIRKKNSLLWKMSGKDIVYELDFFKKEYDTGKLSLKEYTEILKRMGYTIEVNQEKETLKSVISAVIKSPVSMENLDVKVSEDKAFVLNDSRKLFSLRDLANTLPDMSEQVFTYHTTNGRNDFADWIKNIFLLDELSNKVRSCKTKEELILILKN